jgi:Beta-galactosidase, domain 3/Beta-galactosidase, domain 2/Beta-galactosidase jelly roll domain
MDVDVLVLYLQEGQTGQFTFKNAPAGLTYKTYGSSNFTSTTTNGTQSFVYTQGVGQTTIKFSDGLLIYLLDLPTAWQFWAPPTTSNPDVLPNQQIFVLGPYLVRNASTGHGVVHVSGDSNRTSTIEVYTGDSIVHTIVWNGERLAASKTPCGSFTAQIPGTESRSVSLPALTNWKSGDSLPETNPSFDDSKWTVCNKNTTLSPVAPLSLPVLFSSDYGFYTGAKIYRGYFDGTNATSVNLTT